MVKVQKVTELRAFTVSVLYSYCARIETPLLEV